MSFLTIPNSNARVASNLEAYKRASEAELYSQNRPKLSNQWLPDERFLDAVRQLKDDPEASRVSIKGIVHCNFRRDFIHAIHPSAMAWKFASHIGRDTQDDSQYRYALSTELKALVQSIWRHDSRCPEYQSIRVRRPQLGVDIHIQVQTRVSIRQYPIKRQKDDVVFYIGISSTHDSDGKRLQFSQTVYCCGKAVGVRIAEICGIYWGLDLKLEEPLKARLLKRMKAFWRSSNVEELEDEKQPLLMQ